MHILLSFKPLTIHVENEASTV